MKKITFTILISIFLISAQAQTVENIEKSLLWEISGNGLEKPSYIFGTMHLVPKDDYFFTDVMKAKFDSCDKLILEIDIDIPLSKQIEIAKQVILPEGKRLSNYMSTEDFEAFQSYIIDTLQIKKSTFNKINKIKPLLGSSLIINELAGKTKAYEKELAKLAKKNKMEVLGLETIEFQMGLINNISVEEQIKMMKEEGGFTGNPMDTYNIMLEAYKKQDLTALKELMDADESMMGLEDDFLKNRNKDWIPKIEALAKQSSVFIAVGAGHLPGKGGILNLLKEKAYVITAIK